MGCNKSKPALAGTMEKGGTDLPPPASTPPPLKHGRKTSVMANPHFYDGPNHAGEKRRSTILVKEADQGQIAVPKNQNPMGRLPPPPAQVARPPPQASPSVPSQSEGGGGYGAYGDSATRTQHAGTIIGDPDRPMYTFGDPDDP